jgi:hypothetical protein
VTLNHSEEDHGILKAEKISNMSGNKMDVKR